MKIAFFVRSMVNGGAEKVAAQLTCIWAGLGHETVLLTELPKSDGCEYGCECTAREVVGGEAAIVPQRLRNLHEKYGFEVAVFNDAINSDWFTAAFDEAKAIGLRTIIINHHTSNNWMYGCCNTKELFMDDVLRKADAMVCVDRIWALWWKYRGVNSVFIQNPVSVAGCQLLVASDANDQRPTANDYPLTLVKNVDEAVEKLNGKRNIVWVGRLDDVLKRAELAIEVFAKLLVVEDWDDVNRKDCKGHKEKEDVGCGMKLVMLGACAQATKKRLLSLRVLRSLRRKNVAVHIEFPGFVTNVGDYLAKADAHLFTSVTEVTVPQVILEAMAAGVETIAFDQPVLRGGSGTMGDNAISEKWRKVLAGEDVECDFDTPEARQNLMDELHRSQQWFSIRHLPELFEYRRLKARVNPLYLVHRFAEKARRKS